MNKIKRCSRKCGCKIHTSVFLIYTTHSMYTNISVHSPQEVAEQAGVGHVGRAHDPLDLMWNEVQKGTQRKNRV